MMESYKLRQQVGENGILHLDVPVGLSDREVEVMVIYQPVPSDFSAATSLAELYGVCADAPINIDDSGIDDTLDEDLAGAFE
ncbi:MAG: hypothetical protein AAF892_18905 [Cyanobacteria bacterium P01_D01_bin.71]